MSTSALALVSAPATPAGSATPAEPRVFVDPTMNSVARWGRLAEGELFAWSRRIEWAVRMKRTFGLQVLICPRCSRKMRSPRPHLMMLLCAYRRGCTLDVQRPGATMGA